MASGGYFLMLMYAYFINPLPERYLAENMTPLGPLLCEKNEDFMFLYEYRFIYILLGKKPSSSECSDIFISIIII